MEGIYEQWLANTFPKTPEEFDMVEVLSTTLVRINLVKWMSDMLEKHIKESHPDREKFLFFTETMKSSHSNTNYLYKIQAAYNLDHGTHVNVVPGNLFYDILLRAHEFWANITTEFRNIFTQYNLQNEHKTIFKIPTNPLGEKAVQIIQSIVTNETLKNIMPQLQENSATILGHIQTWEACTLPPIKL